MSSGGIGDGEGGNSGKGEDRIITKNGSKTLRIKIISMGAPESGKVSYI